MGHPTQGQPQQPAFSSSDSDVHAENGTSPFQKATPGELDHPASLRITRDHTPDPNGLPSLLPGMNDIPGHVLEDDGDGSTEHHAKLVAPDGSEKEAARVEHERIADLERQLSEALAERAQLTDQLVEKSALLEQAKSELAAVRLRLMDAEVGWAKSKAEADALRAGTQAAAGLVNMDVDRVMRRLMERVRSVEAEMASLRGDEKSIGEMECRNEG